MLRFAALAAVGALSAAGAAQAVVMLNQAGQPPQLRQGQAAMSASADVDSREGTAAGEPAAIVRSPDGHYWAEAVVNGGRVRFLVDTGATTVALTAADALRLGIDPKTLDYGYEVSTASGKARAARIQLASVSVAGAKVSDVDAMVIEDGLATSLLGMTYLGRLSGWEARQGSLILRP